MNWCRLLGHDVLEEALHYYVVLECRRCGKVYDDQIGPREWIRVRLWLLSIWLKDHAGRWSYWLRCSDCGRRFGRHDESKDHLPF